VDAGSGSRSAPRLRRFVRRTFLADQAYRSTFLVWFVVLLALSGSTVLGGMAFIQAQDRDQRLAETMVEEQGVVFAQLAAVKERLSLIRSDLFFLKNEFEYLLGIDLEPDAVRRVAGSEFQNFSKSRGIYDQIRILDRNGQEFIRVNYNGGSPIIVGQERLQDQSSRPYVLAANKLDQGATYVSPLDLNVDNGVVTQPYKPTIRLATPLIGPDGERQGLIVLNYMAASMLTAVEAAADLSLGDPMMLNSDGYWLVSKVPPPTWGFMFDDKIEDRMENLFPLTWAEMQGSSSDQLLTEEGLFSFAAIDPVSDIMIGARDFEGFIPPRAVAGNAESAHRWFVGTFLDAETLESALDDGLSDSFTYSGLLLALCVFGSAAASLAIAEARRHRSDLAQMARLDPLTGLSNRRTLEAALASEIANARQAGGGLAVAFLDIDGFKTLNDRLGHAAGDQALIDIAEVLTRRVELHDSQIRDDTGNPSAPDSMVSRIGGDKFVILFRGDDPHGRIKATLTDVLTAIGALSWRKQRVGASIGLARFPGSGETMDAVLNAADAAMYRAKVGGKNRIIVDA